MLFLSVTSFDSMCVHHGADAIELRLDLFPTIDLGRIESFLQNSLIPVLLTLRKWSHGGGFQQSEARREALIERLLALEPHFFDLEYDMRPEFLYRVIKNFSKTQFVLSDHYFEKMPRDLDAIYDRMQQYSVFCYKIAAMTPSANDALRLLLFGKKHPKISVVCMSEKNNFGRVLGPIMGNEIDFACLDTEKKSGLGQLTISELTDIYNYPGLNTETAIYGLVGNSIDNSPGHLYHNAIFRKCALNAVYVKMPIEPEELSDFISLAEEIGIQGLSVTSPLKERVVSFIDEIDPSMHYHIGAINTLVFKQGKILGTNTDGLGALDAIEKKALVRGKKMVLIGAGGAARAIAFEAHARGAKIIIVNRTVSKAIELAALINGMGGGLSDIPLDYDILVNCSVNPMPIDPQKIRPKTMVMDAIYFPRESAFLEAAIEKECSIVYGEEMYVNQAALQTHFWIGS